MAKGTIEINTGITGQVKVTEIQTDPCNVGDIIDFVQPNCPDPGTIVVFKVVTTPSGVNIAIGIKLP